MIRDKIKIKFYDKVSYNVNHKVWSNIRKPLLTLLETELFWNIENQLFEE